MTLPELLRASLAAADAARKAGKADWEIEAARLKVLDDHREANGIAARNQWQPSLYRGAPDVQDEPPVRTVTNPGRTTQKSYERF